MANLVAYLGFNGNCKEAMNFYKNCLGGDLKLMTYGESPMGAQTPAPMKSRIMHSSLMSGKIALMAADRPEAGEQKHGNTIALCLICDSKEEINSLFKKLSAGGKVEHPLKEEFFGWYGDLTDKFGFGWMFQYSATPM